MHRSEYSVYTTGSWQPFPGRMRPSSRPGRSSRGGPRGSMEPVLGSWLGTCAEGRYVGFLGWSDMEAVRGWKEHSEFKARMSRVQQFVDKFAPTELEVVARLQGEA